MTYPIPRALRRLLFVIPIILLTVSFFVGNSTYTMVSILISCGCLIALIWTR